MKEESKKAFFEYVKDKKIRLSGWKEDRCFVPYELSFDLIMFGDREGGGLECNGIYKGFEPDKDGEYWEFYKEEPKKITVLISCEGKEIKTKISLKKAKKLNLI